MAEIVFGVIPLAMGGGLAAMCVPVLLRGGEESMDGSGRWMRVCSHRSVHLVPPHGDIIACFQKRYTPLPIAEPSY
jgi:hypothetical protein